MTSQAISPDDAVRRAINSRSVASAIVGAILSPIPLIDELALIPIYGTMARRIGKLRLVPRGQMPWRPIIRTTLNGLMARAALNLTVSYIPGVAAVANAASAAALRHVLGQYVDKACAAPAEAKPVGVKAIVTALSSKLPRRATVTP